MELKILTQDADLKTNTGRTQRHRQEGRESTERAQTLWAWETWDKTRGETRHRSSEHKYTEGDIGAIT